MSARRRLGAVALAGAAAAMSLFAPQLTARADTANHECDNQQDITVVVDFQELIDGNSNDVNVRCAPQPVDSGLDALDRANISWEPSTKGPFVCRIAGLPDASDEPCNRYPPASAYWVYWFAEPGGQWTYSQYGADVRTPPPGSFEGWSFAKNRDAGSLPPPRYLTPKPLPTTTTEAPTPGTAPPPTNVTSSPTTRGSRSTSITTAVTSVANSSGTTTSTSVVVVAASPLSPSTSIALGHVDLSVDHADHGSPLAFVLGVAGVVIVGGAGVLLARARRARA